MFYDNEIKTKKYRIKRNIIHNFSKGMNADKNEYNLDFDCAKLTYNLKIQNDVLTLGNGFDDLRLPNTKTGLSEARTINFGDYNILKLSRYKYYSMYNQCDEYILIMYCSDKYLRYIPMFFYTQTILPLNFQFNETPVSLSFRINGNDVMGFCSPSDNFLVWFCDNEPYQVTTAPKFKSLCLHNERLFAIDSEKNYLVRYSSNLNPLDWTSSVSTSGAGAVELNDYKGQLKKLISFLDNVFVFRDFGISKISSYSANSNFVVTNIYNSSSKIYCETACVCGEMIFFLAEDGLYWLDGYKVEKVMLNISKLFESVSNDNANTCFHDGKLYIACRLNFSDDNLLGCENNSVFINNSLIEYEISTKKFNITRGVDICSMLSVKDLTISKIIVAMNGFVGKKLYQLNSSGNLLLETLEKSWQSGQISFGEFDKKKILKEINLLSKFDCEFFVKTEKGSKIFNIKAKDEIQRVRINLLGKFFSVGFKSNNPDVFISSPQFVFMIED